MMFKLIILKNNKCLVEHKTVSSACFTGKIARRCLERRFYESEKLEDDNNYTEQFKYIHFIIKKA